MAHFGNDVKTRNSTPVEWLKLNAQVGALVNTWAVRGDLVVNLNETTQMPAPALFNPASAEIEVCIPAAFGFGVKPAEVGDLGKRKHQLRFPKASGAIFHEALHARFTRWSLEKAYTDLSPKAYGAIHLLEEGRIEAWGIRVAPANRVFLRASALEIVVADLDKAIANASSVESVAKLMALTSARVDAGILDAHDVAPADELIETVLGADIANELREVWVAFQAHTNHDDATELYALANKWVEIIERAKTEQGEDEGGEGETDCEHPGGGTPGGESGGEPSGEPSEDEGSEEGKPTSSPIDKVREAIKEILDEIKDKVEIANNDEVADAEQEEDWAEQVREREEIANEKDGNEKVAEQVFHGHTKPAGSGSGSRLVETRQPTSNERIAAVQIAKALERAKYRDRSQTEINTVVPPGKLRTRALVQGAAMKAKGVRGNVEPWRKTVRKQTETPELKIGVMVDISGSMGMAMQPMAVTAWAISEATRRVDGKCGMVYYGSGVFSTLKPGQHLKEVKVYSAPDGTEMFDKGFKALDGAMNLLHGNGARLLVVVSDGHYTPEERANATKWLKRCHQQGVAVLWISYGDDLPKTLVKDYGQVVVLGRTESTETTAKLIGKAAVDAINKVLAK